MHPVSELNEVAQEFHHLQAEHAREGAEGSWRRRQRARLDELEQTFETLLLRWVPDTGEQARWREHLYRGAEQPSEPTSDKPPEFLGRSEIGSTLMIRTNNGEHELLLDGALIARWPLRRTIDTPLVHDGSVYDELFEAPPTALEALLDYVERRADSPPWAWARALWEDGLIDSTFGLTPRGRRYYASRRKV